MRSFAMQTLNSPDPIPVALSDLGRLQQLRTGQLTGLKRLDLSCGLTEFPPEIFELADSLEILNLSGNALSSLPDDLHRLHKLRVLFCSDNRFTELPEAIGRCPAMSMIGFKANQIEHVPSAALPEALRWLILTDNRITSLPESLGRCASLQKLMLSGNRLQHLPESMVHCHQLELLRIAANRFEVLPAWLFTLPRLAWLACAGNPLSNASEAVALAAHPMPLIGWQDLHIDRKVGEGASGVIYLGTWQQRMTTPVAVKLFKGAMTSDGLPQSEMAASIAAGTHANLIGVKGCVVGHPDGVEGIVMTPIDAVFGNLAGPPSFDSCTRDVYLAGQRFDVSTVLGIALQISSAAAHLHARGILHGDLYAHNILWDGECNALLGDFGAAAFFATGTDDEKTTALAMQRLEARAFGCLLEELMERCDASPEQRETINALTALQQRCLNHDAGARPLLSEICEALTRLA